MTFAEICMFTLDKEVNKYNKNYFKSWKLLLKYEKL